MFYTDDSLLASSHPYRLQSALGVLTSLFDHVGIQTNFGKVVGMTCQLCHTSGSLLNISDTWGMTGLGPFYKERQRESIQCLNCRAELVDRSLETHCQTQHGIGRTVQWEEAPEEAQSYRVSLPRMVGAIACPLRYG